MMQRDAHKPALSARWVRCWRVRTAIFAMKVSHFFTDIAEATMPEDFRR